MQKKLWVTVPVLQAEKKPVSILMLCQDQDYFTLSFPQTAVDTICCIHLQPFKKIKEQLYLSPKADILLIELPSPDSLWGSCFYTKQFWKDMQSKLTKNGTVTILLPGSKKEEKTFLKPLEVMRQKLNTLFRYVSFKPCGMPLIICGQEPLLCSPEILDKKAEEILKEDNDLPKGIFQLMNTDSQFSELKPSRNQILDDTPENIFRMWLSERYETFFDVSNLQNTGSLIVWSGLFLCLILCIIRYFYSGGQVKNCFLATENGIYAGLLIVFAVMKVNHFSFCGWLCLTSAGIYIGSFLCRSNKKWGMPISAVAGISAIFIAAAFDMDPAVCLASGVLCGCSVGFQYQRLKDHSFEFCTGISMSLLAGSVIYLLDGTLLMFVAAFLTRLPGLVGEKITKGFENYKISANV